MVPFQHWVSFALLLIVPTAQEEPVGLFKSDETSTQTATSVSLYRKMTLVGNMGPKTHSDFLMWYRLDAVAFS